MKSQKEKGAPRVPAAEAQDDLIWIEIISILSQAQSLVKEGEKKMEEKELIKILVEIGSDNSGNVYAYVTGYVSSIIKSEIHTSDEKVSEQNLLAK